MTLAKNPAAKPAGRRGHGGTRGSAFHFPGLNPAHSRSISVPVRPLIPTVLLLLFAPVLLSAQDNIPLPDKKGSAPLPQKRELPPAAQPAADMPRVQMAPTAPVFPKRPTVAPSINFKPKGAGNESSVQGGQFHVYGAMPSR